jgi:hypothetical protein
MLEHRFDITSVQSNHSYWDGREREREGVVPPEGGQDAPTMEKIMAFTPGSVALQRTTQSRVG